MSDVTQAALRNRFRWTKLTSPGRWAPKEGDEIAGFFMGTVTLDGAHGQYQAVSLAVPGQPAPLLVAGTHLLSLIESSMVVEGAALRIRFDGLVETSNGRRMKHFTVWLGEDHG